LHKLKLEKLPKTCYITSLLESPDFIKAVKDNCNLSNIYTEDEAKFIEAFKSLSIHDETEFVGSILSQLDLVTSHNDIWSGNILVTKDLSDVLLIDYEMVAYNFQGFDIGRLVLETMFYRPDSKLNFDYVEENYPSEGDITDFLRYYQVSYKGNLTKEEEIKIIQDDELLQDFENKLFALKSDYNDAIAKLQKQVIIGLMVTGYRIALICMMIGKNPAYGMDFIKAAKDGYNVYFKYKKQLLDSTAKPEII